jgi:hypothetical protein
MAGSAKLLSSDCAGREDLHLMLLHRAPKYGNDDDTVDALVGEITGWNCWCSVRQDRMKVCCCELIVS